MTAYQLVSLGFIAGFGTGGLAMLWFWRRSHPEDFGSRGLWTVVAVRCTQCGQEFDTWADWEQHDCPGEEE